MALQAMVHKLHIIHTARHVAYPMERPGGLAQGCPPVSRPGGAPAALGTHQHHRGRLDSQSECNPYQGHPIVTRTNLARPGRSV